MNEQREVTVADVERNRYFLVIAGADSIRKNMNPKAVLEQVERSLKNADVRLDTLYASLVHYSTQTLNQTEKVGTKGK